MRRWLASLILIIVGSTAAIYAPPAAALERTAPQVLLVAAQAGAPSAAGREYVVIYNNSTEGIGIAGWCVTNKSSVRFACFDAPLGALYYLPARSFAVVVSTDYALAHPGAYTQVYEKTHQTNGSLTGSADTVSLIDAGGVVRDSTSWASLAAGSTWMRQMSAAGGVFIDTDTPSDWVSGALVALPAAGAARVMTDTDICDNIAGLQYAPPLGFMREDDGCYLDVCTTLDGLQKEVPIGYESDGAGACTLPDTCLNIIGVQVDVPPGYDYDDANSLCVPPQVLIREIFANAAGDDEGKEFIELYNPHATDIAIRGAVLVIAGSSTQRLALPALTVPAMGYIVLDQSYVPFRLPNTWAQISIVDEYGLSIADDVEYSDPKDDMAWALIAGVWQYTNQPTPGYDNLPSQLATPRSAVSSTPQSSLTPCAANQYRSPETNRCRLVETSNAAALVACKEGQERNPDTNRCRAVAGVTSSLAPCAEGQERNPETNRCRTIQRIAEVPHAPEHVGAAESHADTGYIAWAIAGVAIVGGLYALWEWREEIAKASKRTLQFVRTRK